MWAKEVRNDTEASGRTDRTPGSGGASPNSAWNLGRDFYFELLYNVGTDRTLETLEEGLTEFTP